MSYERDFKENHMLNCNNCVFQHKKYCNLHNVSVDLNDVCEFIRWNNDFEVLE